MPFISTSNTSESTSRRQSSSSKTHLLRFHFVFSSSSLLLSRLLSGISYIHTYCIWVETQNKHIMQLCSYPLLNSMSYMCIVYVYVFKLLKCHLHWTHLVQMELKWSKENTKTGGLGRHGNCMDGMCCWLLDHAGICQVTSCFAREHNNPWLTVLCESYRKACSLLTVWLDWFKAPAQHWWRDLRVDVR